MKNLFLSSMFLLAAALMTGCNSNDEKTDTIEPPVNKTLAVTELNVTDCLNRTRTDETEQESFYVKLQAEGILKAEHKNLQTNCGYERMQIGAKQSGDTIIIKEDVYIVASADCICSRNVSFKVSDIQKKKYFVKLCPSEIDNSTSETFSSMPRIFTIDLENSDEVTVTW